MRITALRKRDPRLRLSEAQVRLLVLAGFCCIVAACNFDRSADDCWARMLQSYHALSVLAQEGRLNKADAETKKRELRGLLSECAGRCEYTISLDGVIGSRSGFLNLADIAAVADDGPAVREYARKHTDVCGQPLATQSEQHLYGGNTLQLAATMESSAAVEALVRAGCDVNARDAQGFTALHLASAQTPGGELVIRTLVDGGANVNAATTTGITPLDMAVARSDATAQSVLIKLGAKAGKDQPTQSLRKSDTQTAGSHGSLAP